ncbi:PAS domain-containing protein [Rhodobacter maris]|uniref:PAS domain-containing protein n=1 Tax=Rhodobacter maris TaxID=446682 RepID=A0A285T312_9RHOB|nr:PAS domain-containing protein [Rhodobacter maris]SOC15331.1 PAS domain-containing protein [Rhodobacter maris]
MTRIPSAFADLPMPVLELSAPGTARAVNPAAQDWLAEHGTKGQDCGLDTLFAEASADRLGALLEGADWEPRAFPVWLLGADAAEEQPAVTQCMRRDEGGLWLFVMRLSEVLPNVSADQLERAEILSQMIGAARDACWCIDFLDPVDLRRTEEEIVDQVFRNRSRWRACNDAMAALYAVPEDQDFNTQPVSRYFPETPVNRAMIRDLVHMGYRLDGAQAIDQRHDGTAMLVENDFRALIRDDFLIRLWGTTRDIGPSRAREREISAEAEVMRDILGAVPDPIFVLSEAGIILATNPAAERALGDVRLLGEPFDSLAASRHAFERLCLAALADDEEETELALREPRQPRAAWLFRVTLMPEGPPRYVLRGRRKALRRRSPGGEPA